MAIRVNVAGRISVCMIKGKNLLKGYGLISVEDTKDLERTYLEMKA